MLSDIFYLLKWWVCSDSGFLIQDVNILQWDTIRVPNCLTNLCVACIIVLHLWNVFSFLSIISYCALLMLQLFITQSPTVITLVCYPNSYMISLSHHIYVYIYTTNVNQLTLFLASSYLHTVGSGLVGILSSVNWVAACQGTVGPVMMNKHLKPAYRFSCIQALPLPCMQVATFIMMPGTNSYNFIHKSLLSTL